MDECGEFSFGASYKELSERRLFGLADLVAAEEIGVLKLRRQDYPDLTGRGVFFAIADTGERVIIMSS